MNNLGTKSLSELKKLQSAVDREIAKRQQQSKGAVLREVEKLVRGAGLSVAELLGTGTADAPKRRGRKPKVTEAADANGAATPAKRKGRAKFANPDDPSKKWTGKGRKPQWLIDHLANGKTLDDLRIGKKAQPDEQAPPSE